MQDFLWLGLILSLVTTLPLAWKWSLGLLRTALAVAVLSVSTGLAVHLFGDLLLDGNSTALKAVLNWLLTLNSAVLLLAYRFYRDPDRTTPSGDDLVVSPADGKILYVRESRDGVLPVSTKNGRNYTLDELTRTPLNTQHAWVIGVAMSFLDVHVNRAPIAGRVAVRRHFAGRFGSLRLPEMTFENERATTVIEREGLQIAVVQIASRLVRQIVSFVHENQTVTLGQRIGVIRLGSQVDLVLPATGDIQITAKVGERVTAGQSVLARVHAGARSVADPHEHMKEAPASSKA